MCLLIKVILQKSHRKADSPGDLITAVSIARLTSAEVFDDDGGKTHRGGKKQRGQHKTGGAVAQCSATNHIQMRHKPSNKITK